MRYNTKMIELESEIFEKQLQIEYNILNNENYKRHEYEEDMKEYKELKKKFYDYCERREKECTQMI